MENYFTADFITGFLLICSFIVFPRPFYYAASLVHEIGHAMGAITLGAKNIHISIGSSTTGNQLLNLQLRLLTLNVAWSRDYHGMTSYDIESDARIRVIFITIFGLFASLLAASVSVWIHSISINTSFAIQMILIINFVVNAKFFILSVYPKELPPSEDFPEGWRTDGKMILDLLKQSK